MDLFDDIESEAVLPLAPGVVRVWLPPDANSLLTVADQCLRSRDHVNVVIADKQPHLQYMSEDQAREQVAAGASTTRSPTPTPSRRRPARICA